MGLIISKFRKQKTTIEILEEIEKNIATHQRFKRQNQEYQKKFIASLILYSIILYVVVTVLFFICYFPQTWKDWLFASIPLLLFPVLIWLVKKLMHWYFVKRISSNEIALQELRDKKKDILEDVMENETYKKAKEILERFDPARFKKLEIEKPAENKSGTAKEQVPEVVRQRIITTRTLSPVMRMPNPVQPMSAPHPHQRVLPNPSIGSPMQMVSQMNGRQMSMVPPGYGRSPGPPMPRPVPPRERKNLDKFIDYLVGEGPQNRYALICRYCHSHNGMAMKEEFEYISFRCCYCYHLNPAKKQRPHAPRLDFPTPQSSPTRKAIAAPDSKSNEDKESSEGEDEDEDSTSSRKSEDETIETEREGGEAGDGTAVAASISVAEPAVVSVEEDADNIPMADDNGIEENTEEGVEKNAEDETAPSIGPDELAETGNIGDENLAVDNQPQEEETETQPKENKTATEKIVVSKCSTMEYTSPKSTEKTVQGFIKATAKSIETSPQQVREVTPESMGTVSPKTIKEDFMSTDATAKAHHGSAAIEHLKIALEDFPTTEENPMIVEALGTVDTSTEELSVPTETNTQQIAMDVVMTAETATKGEPINTKTVSEEFLMTAESQMTKNASSNEEVSINKDTEVLPISVDTAAADIPAFVGSDDQQITEEALTTENTRAEDFPTKMDATNKEALLMAEETLVTSDTLTGKALMSEETVTQQIANEALVTVDTAIGKALMSAETVAPQIATESFVTVDAATGEALTSGETVTQEITNEALVTANTASGEALMSVENVVQQIANETLLTADTATGESLMSVSTDDQQFGNEALVSADSVTGETQMSAETVAPQIANESSVSADTATEGDLMPVEKVAQEFANKALVTADTTSGEDLMSAETIAQQIANETLVTVDTATGEASMPMETIAQQIANEAQVITDTGTGESPISVDSDAYQVANKAFVTTETATIEMPMSIKNDTQQIAKEMLMTVDSATMDALKSVKSDDQQVTNEAGSATIEARRSVKTSDEQTANEALLNAESATIQALRSVKNNDEKTANEALVMAESETIEALRSVKANQKTTNDALVMAESATIEALRSVKANQQTTNDALVMAESATIEALRSVKSHDEQLATGDFVTAEIETIKALRSLKTDAQQASQERLVTPDTATGQTLTSVKSDTQQLAMECLQTKDSLMSTVTTAPEATRDFQIESSKCTADVAELSQSTVFVERPLTAEDEGEFVENRNIDKEFDELAEYEIVAEFVEEEAVRKI